MGKDSWSVGRRAERTGSESREGAKKERAGEKERHRAGKEGRAVASWGAAGRARQARRRGGGRRCQREAASGMQRPEAWPRPHLGVGAAAVQAGGPAPPAGAGEPTGPRVRGRLAGARVRDGGSRAGVGVGAANSQLARRAPGTWCHHQASQGGCRARAGDKKFLPVRTLQACPESAWS